MDGKPVGICGVHKLTRLTDRMIVVWREYEGERWFWLSDTQAYFRLCTSCHKRCWPDDMRCRGPNCRSKPTKWQKWLAERDGVVRLMSGDFFLTRPPPELARPRPQPRPLPRPTDDHNQPSFHDSPATCDYISVCTGSQYPHSIRTVTAQYPHSIRTVSACENRGISANACVESKILSSELLLYNRGFAKIPVFSHADTVRILCGYCADTVRIL